MGRIICCVLLFLCSLNVCAEASWVEAVGSAPLEGDWQQARKIAMDDAMRKALLTRGAQVQSSSTVEGQVTVSDSVSVRARGQITRVEVLTENAEGELLEVAIRAQIKSPGQCSDKLQGPAKAVVFTQFKRQYPAHSNIGQLHQIDFQLPEELARRGYSQSWFLAQTEPAPLQNSAIKNWGGGDSSTSQVRKLAQQSGAQYVVSGEITNLNMETPESYLKASGFGKKIKKLKWWQREQIDQRQFGMHLRVFEAITGNVIFDQQYQTRGRWTFPAAKKVSFQSPQFWRSDFGAQLSALLDKAVEDVGRKLQCQPLIVPVQQVTAQNFVYLELGSNQGLKVGDVLSVFQHDFITPIGANYQQTRALAQMDMVSTPVTITVEQVHPLFSRARLSKPLNNARNYVGVVW